MRQSGHTGSSQRASTGNAALAAFNRGIQALNVDEFPGATHNFETAIELHPPYPEAHFWAGVAYDFQYVPGATSSPENGRMADVAAKHFQTVLDLPDEKITALRDGDDAVSADRSLHKATLIHLGSVYRKTKQFDLARTNYKKASEIDPDNKVPWYYLALTALRMDEDEVMNADMKVGARSLMPGYFETPVRDRLSPNAVRSLRQSLQPVLAQGISDGERAVKLDPQYASAMEVVSTLHQMTAELAQSQDSYRTGVARSKAWYEKAVAAKKSNPGGRRD